MGRNKFGSKKFGSKKLPLLFWIQKILDQNSRAKNFRSKKCRSTNSRPPKYYLVKIGSVTAKIFLIWTNVTRTNVAWTNVTVTVGICLRWSKESTLVKIGLVTDEIFLKWTNVAGTNIARTNVTVTVDIFTNGSRNLHLIFGQIRVSNS